MSENVAGLRHVDFCSFCGWQKLIIREEQQGKKTLLWCGCREGETAMALPKPNVGTVVDQTLAQVHARKVPKAVSKQGLSENGQWFLVGILLGIAFGGLLVLGIHSVFPLP